jgi:RNA polymerase sigma-70 factor (ECF subfamily)
MDALEELIGGFHRDLFTFLHLLGIPPKDIEEVAQDVVIQMHRSLGRYSGEQPFLPWLRSIARHVVANYWRTHRAEERKMKAFQRYLERKLDDRPQDRGGYLEIDAARLEDCMSRLQDKHREMLALRYQQGFDSGKIACAMGLQAPAVRQSLSRIRDILKACVEGTLRPSSAT